MIHEEEKQVVAVEVQTKIMPEIKSSIPFLVGWIIRTIFPKLETKIIFLVQQIVANILKDREENERD